MNDDKIQQWLVAGLVRPRQLDIPRIRSMIESSEKKAAVVKNLKLTEDSTLVIFPSIYDATRQLGDALLWIKGYEPLASHEVSMQALSVLTVKNKILLNQLDRFRKIRNNASYRGHQISVENTKDILDFWEKCGEEIISMLKNMIERV